MKYFGQYLVSKNIITEDILVTTLIEQLATLPSLVEIAHRKKLFSSSKILEALSFQFEKKVEFRQACVELGFWNQEVDNEVKRYLESIRIPLGQLLIKNGNVDLTTITKSLDDFLSRVEAPLQIDDSLSQIVYSEKSLTTESKTSERLLDAVLIEEFAGFISDTKIENLLSSFSLLKDQATDADMSRPLLTDLLIQIHSLRGLMRCIQIERSSTLIEKLEVFIVRVLDDLKLGKLDLISNLAKFGTFTMSLLSPLRESLLKHRSESHWLENSESSKTYELLMKEVIPLK